MCVRLIARRERGVIRGHDGPRVVRRARNNQKVILSVWAHSKNPCRLLRYRSLSRICSIRLSLSTSSALVSAASARRT